MSNDSLESAATSGKDDKERLEHSRVLHILMAGKLLGPLIGVAFGLLLVVVFALLIYARVGESRAWAMSSLAAVFLSMVFAAIGAERLLSQLLKPLVRLEQSVFDVCQGQQGAGAPLENVGVLGAVMEDIGSLSVELDEVYEDMDDRVARQTRRLAQQTTFLKILYDVAAEINHANTLDALLMRFLQVLKKMLNGRSATVSLISRDGRMRLVGSVEEDDVIISGQEQIPIPLCKCGKALTHGDVLCQRDPASCMSGKQVRMYGQDSMEVVDVPLMYHDERLGIYHVYVERTGISSHEELMELLATIGNHLGMAVAKHRSDEEAHRLSIVEERTNMAHELHDSLAQTLASLRYQVRMLEDSLHQDRISPASRNDLLRMRNGLDEAHTELRELLSSFLTPVEQRGLIRTLEKVVQRFEQDSGVAIFFQHRCSDNDLSPTEELQIVRIVQECLANIRKHAGAKNVRVLLSRNAEGSYRLLIEDDGMGFDDASPKGEPGEHIGLSIMDERARKLAGELRIESEKGEGTRVELTYNPLNRKARAA